MNKRIAVVTGANGFVGSHLVDHLLEKNYEVRCIVRKSSNLKWLNGKDIEIINTGLLDKEGLRKAFKGADYIYHVAGVVKAKKPEGYFEGNVEPTKTMLEVAAEDASNLKRFVVVSSQTAGGPSLNGIPITEKDECKPITTYGKSKLAQEETALKFKDRLPVTICRAPAVYGERDTEIFIFFDTFNKGLMTTIGFDKKVVSLIHVRDLVEGLVMAGESEKAAGEVYYVSSEKYYSWDEVGEATTAALGKKPFKVKVPHTVVYLIATIAQGFSYFKKAPATLNIEKAKDLTRRSWICDAQKSAEDFGFRQRISLQEGIKRTIDWYKKEGWLK